jgi:hypothetical protein
MDSRINCLVSDCEYALMEFNYMFGDKRAVLENPMDMPMNAAMVSLGLKNALSNLESAQTFFKYLRTKKESENHKEQNDEV